MKRLSGIACRLTLGAALFGVLLGTVCSVAGYREFTAVLQQQYTDAAYEAAEAAYALLNPDKFAQYMEGGQVDEEHAEIQARLDALADAANAASIYVVQADSSDYETITYIYDSVNSGAEESGARITAELPVRDSSGKVVAVVGVEKAMTRLENARSTYVVHMTLWTLAAIALFLAVYSVVLRRGVITPILTVADEAERFAETNEGSDRLLAISRKDEIGTLAKAVGKMERDIAEYTRRITSITKEKELVNTELTVATRIQANMLPSIFPAFPEREEFDIYATMNPAKEVGGDFYDFFMVDSRHLAIVMADVSGKGIPAALFMVIGKTLIKDHTQPDRDLGQVFTEVNELLCESNSEGLFITAFEGVLDLCTGEFRFVNAGHEIPYICKKGGRFEPHKIRPAFVLAGMEGMRYKCGSMQLEEGDKIFQYTDGVTEATDKGNQLYGQSRLTEILDKYSDLPPGELLPRVKEDIDRFVGEASQFDDITMLCLEYKKKMRQNVLRRVHEDTGGVIGMKELTVDATIESVSTITAFVNEQLELLGCPLKAQMQIDVAVDEIFSSIAYYAYQSEVGPATVRIETEENPLTVVVTFIDSGVEYNPLEKEDPDAALSAEGRGIGGLGIFMVKKTMDDVSYAYRDGQNILQIKKILETEASWTPDSAVTKAAAAAAPEQEELSALQDKTLDKLAQLGQVRLYKAQEYICYEGQPGSEMYVILRGSVGVYVSNMMDTQIQVARLGAGDFFGEMALLDNQPRSASCIALESVVCVGIGKDKLQQFVAASPDLVLNMLEGLSLRNRGLTNELYKSSTAVSTGHMTKFEIPAEYCSHNVPKPPADQAFIEPVTAVCPICGESVVVYNVKKLNMTSGNPSRNGRTIYKECDPLWHSIWNCPHCHYSNIYSRFFGISADEKNHIRQALEEQQVPVIRQHPDLTTDFDLLFIHYLQAIHINLAAGGNLLVGRLWQYLYWLFDDAHDLNMKKYCAENSTAALSAAMEANEVNDDEARLTMQLSMTDMYGALGNSAARACSEVLAGTDHSS